MGALAVTIDFLMPPAPGQDQTRRVQPLQPDFGALVTPGLELAFEERVWVGLEGMTLTGERARREIPVCGQAAFVVLKALTFADRAELKDAYDLVYVVRRTPGRGEAIAERLREHVAGHPDVVNRTLDLLSRDFDTPDALSPQRAADFMLNDPEQRDRDAADAHGFVDDLLRAYQRPFR